MINTCLIYLQIISLVALFDIHAEEDDGMVSHGPGSPINQVTLSHGKVSCVLNVTRHEKKSVGRCVGRFQ